MIAPASLYRFLEKKGVSFFSGVPDSLLKYFLKYVADHSAAENHLITANEGLAIGLASGYYLRSGRLPLVYLQNSGLGNTINPLTSLADQEMYGIPLLLMIGWRGQPGINDEPQHRKMGRITIPLLDVLEIPFYLMEEDEKTSFERVNEAITHSLENRQPVALLVPADVFETYEGLPLQNPYELVREKVIAAILADLSGNETIICTTGKSGREFYEQNLALGKKFSKYFLCAGAMGHANHIALGLQSDAPEKIIMLDGDGALLMHLGALPALAQRSRGNFLHIVINNGSHESVGAQPTGAFSIDLCRLAAACGYENITRITDQAGLEKWLKDELLSPGLHFVEIRTGLVTRSNLGRPQGEPADWKDDFMRAIGTTH